MRKELRKPGQYSPEEQAKMQRDLELVGRAQSGDLEASGGIYEIYAPLVSRFLVKRLHVDPVVIEDLTEDVLAKVLRGLDSFGFRGVPFSSWVFTVANNHMVDYLRSTPAKQAAVTVSLDFVPDHQLQATTNHQRRLEDRAELSPALARLTDDQRGVVSLRFLDGFSVAETAEIMGKTEDAVKKLQARGLAQMRIQIGDSRRAADNLPEARSNGHHPSFVFGAPLPIGRNGHEIAEASPKPETGEQNGNGIQPDALKARRAIAFGYDENRDLMQAQRLARQEEELVRAEQAASPITDLSKKEDALLTLFLPDDPTAHPDLNSIRDLAQRLGITLANAHLLRKNILVKLEAADEHEGPLPRRLRLQLERLAENPNYRNRNLVDRQKLITGNKLGPLGFKQLIALGPDADGVSLNERVHQINRHDLSGREGELSDILFPVPDNYPMIKTMREAAELMFVSHDNVIRVRHSLADKLHTIDTPAELARNARKSELLGRLAETGLYAHTTPYERDQIMWFEIDKATLDQIARDRAAASGETEEAKKA